MQQLAEEKCKPFVLLHRGGWKLNALGFFFPSFNDSSSRSQQPVVRREASPATRALSPGLCGKNNLWTHSTFNKQQAMCVRFTSNGKREGQQCTMVLPGALSALRQTQSCLLDSAGPMETCRSQLRLAAANEKSRNAELLRLEPNGIRLGQRLCVRGDTQLTVERGGTLFVRSLKGDQRLIFLNGRLWVYCKEACVPSREINLMSRVSYNCAIFYSL